MSLWTIRLWAEDRESVQRWYEGQAERVQGAFDAAFKNLVDEPDWLDLGDDKDRFKILDGRSGGECRGIGQIKFRIERVDPAVARKRRIKIPAFDRWREYRLLGSYCEDRMRFLIVFASEKTRGDARFYALYCKIADGRIKRSKGKEEEYDELDAL